MSDIHSISRGALKPPAAAEFLGLSENTLAQWRCRDTGPAYVKLGRTVVYRIETLEAFLRANESGGAK
ncbi:helix-turn-helix transcriptional regulator [Nesterenkonia halotolerans]|uniref:DNA-binding transcriptional regulator AlpA n=1 Tax=Nesterenkonia halotolerans TaxID=225325 RepID=A0ABR9J635_9MICC|nr:helix-turn-helix domain-containing protein [Nesterenkonia halotolerans]MBE1514304.1 putative DNA-binding transcriptional regulator AlpA [Nesterenkonia halotolerans]